MNCDDASRRNDHHSNAAHDIFFVDTNKDGATQIEATTSLGKYGTEAILIKIGWGSEHSLSFFSHLTICFKRKNINTVEKNIAVFKV